MADHNVNDTPSLADMKARNLPHASPADVAEELKLAAVTLPLDDYLANFIKPKGDNDCPRDGGYFIWGLRHGAGHCRKCGWPGILYHFPEDSAGKEHRFEALLWLHPDSLKDRP